MSLPTSEPLPTNINDLPPARQRHIRRQPRAASFSERGLLLDSLLDLTGPSLNFFLLSLFGSLVLGLSLYFNEPVGLILGLVIFPFLHPIFALGIFPHSQNFSHWIKSLISMLTSIILAFVAGILAGYFQKTGQVDWFADLWLNTPYWLNLIAVMLSAVWCTFILIRQGQTPRKVSIILSLEIFFPVAIAGFGLPMGFKSFWPGSLLIGLGHLVLAITIANITFLILSFRPRRVTGWVTTIISLILTLTFILSEVVVNLGNLEIPLSTNPHPTKTFASISTKEPSPTITPETKESPTSTRITQTRTNTATISPSPTHTISPSSTPSPQPTTFIIIVDSLNGLVIRESADYEAPVVSYANNGDIFEVLNQSLSENGSLWYQVELNTGETGWLLSSLVIIQTSTPTENN